jgi:hypothetical protein
MVALRIEMEQNHAFRKHGETHWRQRLESLQRQITVKIEEFASKAEANAYSLRGNIPRPINTNMGGYLNPVELDICIYDLDYLKQFIHDYSRGKK